MEPLCALGNDRFIVEMYFITIERYTPYIFTVSISSLLKVLRMSSLSTEFKNHIVELVKTVMEYRETNNVQRKDFIQLLMELRKTGKIVGDTPNESEKCESTTTGSSKEFMTIEQCAAQVGLFYLAGFDTSASAIANCLFELSRMPDLMERLQCEIDDVLAKYDDVISYESINAMNFLDCCVLGKVTKWGKFGIEIKSIIFFLFIQKFYANTQRCRF